MTVIVEEDSITVLVSSAAGPGSDTDAIHDNIAGEINSITEKATPVNADILIIEDSADSNNKKKVQVGNLPTAAGDMSQSTYDPAAVSEQLVGLTASQKIENKVFDYIEILGFGNTAAAQDGNFRLISLVAGQLATQERVSGSWVTKEITS